MKKPTTHERTIAGVEWRPVDQVVPYDRNPNQHPAGQLQKLARSIQEHGWTKAIGIDADGVIVCGHGEFFAARDHLDMDEVPVRVLDYLDENQVRVLRIADNQIQEESEIDTQLLAGELELLKKVGHDLSLTGLDMSEAEELLATLVDGKEKGGGGSGDPDEVPEVAEEAVTQVGDLWLLGGHRVLCGDSTVAEDVERVMDGENATAILTDPNYGINQPGVNGDEEKKHSQLISRAVPLLPLKNGICASFASTRTFPTWLDAIRENGHHFERMLWMYKAAQCTFPWRGWILTSESILVSTIGAAEWQEVKPYSHDCYYLSEVSGELSPNIGWHGSVKPISVVTDLLSRICADGNIVGDLFLGSGTTLIAAEQLNRLCYGMEIAPKFCDLTIKRWQQFTGLPAFHDGSGLTFDELAEERKSELSERKVPDAS